MRTSQTPPTVQVQYRVAKSALGELVLCAADGALDPDLRELDVSERVALAAMDRERPALVVDSLQDGGRYVVLIDEPVDLDRHVPLSPEEAERFATTTAVARFGRRDDDTVLLTPWSEDDDVAMFDPDDPAFADVPLVELGPDGALRWLRGGLARHFHPVVMEQLRRAGAGEGETFGVLGNVFGECACVAVGAPVLPHEDVRDQTLIGSHGLMAGVSSLAEGVRRLRMLADRMERAEAEGWRLVQPVNDEVLLVERRLL